MYFNQRGEKIIYQNTLLNPFLDVNMAGITYPNPNYRIIHNISHEFAYDYYIFEYIVSGKGYIEVENKKIMVQAGDFYFLNRLSKHVYYSDSDTPYEKLFIVIKGRFVDALVRAYQIHSELLLKNYDAHDLMTEIHDMLDSKQSFSYEKLSIKVLQLFQILCEIDFSTSINSNNYAEIVKNYLDSNLTNRLTLEMICRDCHISPSHVERVFTETYEISPLKYFARAKAQHVASLLRNTNYSLSEIADFLSYSDVKYMSRCFKKWMGETPLNYRKNRGELYNSKETE